MVGCIFHPIDFDFELSLVNQNNVSSLRARCGESAHSRCTAVTQHDPNRRDGEEEEVSGLIPKTPVSLTTITCVFGHVCQQGLHPGCIEIPVQMCHHMLFNLSVKSATWSTQPRHYLWMETFGISAICTETRTGLNSTLGGRLLGKVRLIEIEFSEWLKSSIRSTESSMVPNVQ